MKHRYLDFNGHYGPGTVEEIITRGDLCDWQILGHAAMTDGMARESIRRVTERYANDISMKSCAAWKLFLEKLEKRQPLKKENEQTSQPNMG